MNELQQVKEFIRETNSKKSVNFNRDLQVFSTNDMMKFAKWKDEKSIENTIDLVVTWGKDKGIIKKGNSYKQFAKVVEEVSEIGTALGKDDIEMLIDAIGDSIVTLIILATQNGLTTEQCLTYAYNEIKDRTGKTVNGTFFKD